MITYITVALCAVAYYIFNELEDRTIRGHNYALWPNSNHAWTAKWEYPIKAPTRKWYYFGWKPMYKERFAFSSTILVWLTDTEHLLQFMKNISLYVCILSIDFITFVWFLAGSILARLIKEIFIQKLDE